MCPCVCVCVFLCVCLFTCLGVLVELGQEEEEGWMPANTVSCTVKPTGGSYDWISCPTFPSACPPLGDLLITFPSDATDTLIDAMRIV